MRRPIRFGPVRNTPRMARAGRLRAASLSMDNGSSRRPGNLLVLRSSKLRPKTQSAGFRNLTRSRVRRRAPTKAWKASSHPIAAMPSRRRHAFPSYRARVLGQVRSPVNQFRHADRNGTLLRRNGGRLIGSGLLPDAILVAHWSLAHGPEILSAIISHQARLIVSSENNGFILNAYPVVMLRVVGSAALEEADRMQNSIKISPPNSMLFISDRDTGVVPEITRGTRIWATPSCIVFGCLMFMDGETEVTLGNTSEVGTSDKAAFEGMLESPSRVVVVSTVGWKPILSSAVTSRITRVRIWTNHPTEPDKVVIGLG
jgi:hypothetical protein